MSAIRTDEELRLIAQLRDEAREVKDCATKFCFQALAVSSAALVFMFRALEASVTPALATIPILLFLMAVARINVHKWATANRLWGLELHLDRTYRFDHTKPPWNTAAWKRDMRVVPLEEAMRAWRIVQPALFRALYTTPQGLPQLPPAESRRHPYRLRFHGLNPALFALHDGIEQQIADTVEIGTGPKDRLRYPWFLPKRLAEACGAPYHPGSYLRSILSMLLAMQVLMLLPLLLATGIAGAEWQWTQMAGLAVLTATAAALVYARNRRVQRRRTVLESELLSIHSCSIVWQLVLLAHHEAWKRCNNQFSNYTVELAKVARVLASDPLAVPKWLQAPDAKWQAAGH